MARVASTNRAAASSRRPIDLSDYKDFPSYVKGYFGSAIAAAWLLQDPAGSKMAQVINSAAALGRELIINGDFGSSSGWTPGTNWSISGGVAHAAAVTNVQLLTQIGLVIGKAYTVTYTVLNYVSGSVSFQLGSTVNSTARSANGTYTETLLCAGNTTFGFRAFSGTFTGDIDNVSIKQVNILSSDSYSYKELLSDADLNKVGIADWTAGNSATISKRAGSGVSGGTSLRILYNGVSNPYASQTILTVGLTYRVRGWAKSQTTTPTMVISCGATGLFSVPNPVTILRWRYFDFTFVATATDIRFGSNAVGAVYVEYSNISVAEAGYIARGELIYQGTMDNAITDDWNAFGACTLSMQAGSPHSGTQCLRMARNANNAPGVRQMCLAQGRRYRATGWYRGDGAGNSIPKIGFQTAGSGAIAQGTNSNTWQYFDVTFTATINDFDLFATITNGTDYVEFDDISVIEVPPMTGLYNGTAAAGSGGLSGEVAANFDGSGNINVYSAELNSILPVAEGSFIAYGQVLNSGIWTDGTVRRFAVFSDNVANTIGSYKDSVNNQLNIGILINLVQTGATPTFSGTGFFQVAITWSTAANEVKAYLNGVQVGATIPAHYINTIWNLATNTAVIGAFSTANSTPFKGLESNVILLNRPATSAEIYELARREGLAAA